MRNLARIATAFAILLLTVGCSSGPYKPDNARPVFSVTGTLSFKGAPMDGAVITYYPATQSTTARPISISSTADADGHYTLSTYVTSDGAPAGEYIVTIYWPGQNRGKAPTVDEGDQPLAPDRLKRVYADQKTTKLRATVREQDNVIDFNLP